MSTWTDTGRAGRWFVNDNKAMVVHVEGLGDAWLFTHEFPDGELRSYWGRLIMDPDMSLVVRGAVPAMRARFPILLSIRACGSPAHGLPTVL